jgi:hypothetical protein
MRRVVAVSLWLLWHALAAATAAEYHRYHGCIHVHTRYSDGSGEFADVAAAAQKTGLDYVITTDHNTLQPLKDGNERYWGKLLLLVSTEISTDAGHCLGLDLPPSFEAGTREPQAVIDRVNAAGGFVIVAHPMSPRWLWKGWSVQGYTGIEIANVSSLFDDDLLTVTDGGRIMSPSAPIAIRGVTECKTAQILARLDVATRGQCPDWSLSRRNYRNVGAIRS